MNKRIGQGRWWIVIGTLCAAVEVEAGMTAVQRAAFTGANGGSAAFSAVQLTALIQGVAAVTLFLWFAWVCLSVYKSWGGRNTSGVDAGSQVLRALFLFLVTLVIVSF